MVIPTFVIVNLDLVVLIAAEPQDVVALDTNVASMANVHKDHACVILDGQDPHVKWKYVLVSKIKIATL